jgi:hypothetical protein
MVVVLRQFLIHHIKWGYLCTASAANLDLCTNCRPKLMYQLQTYALSFLIMETNLLLCSLAIPHTSVHLWFLGSETNLRTIVSNTVYSMLHSVDLLRILLSHSGMVRIYDISINVILNQSLTWVVSFNNHVLFCWKCNILGLMLIYLTLLPMFCSARNWIWYVLWSNHSDSVNHA